MNRIVRAMVNGEDKSDEVDAFGRVIRLDGATSGRYSILLLLELYLATVVDQRMNPAKVIREIEALEGKAPSRTMQPKPLSGPELRGLWHKHYVGEGISSVAHNLQNALRKYGIPLFKQRIREAQ